MTTRRNVYCAAVLTTAVIFAGLIISRGNADEGASQSQKPKSQKATRIDFETDIKPLLTTRCASCHAGKEHEGDFSINTRADFLKGGDSGPAVVLGKASKSLLIELVSGAETDRLMPAKGKPLTKKQIARLVAWIDQGLDWKAGFKFDGTIRLDIGPRRPTVPPAEPGSGLTNPIDLLLQKEFQERSVDARATVSDRLFARRVHLDLIGLLPTSTQLDEFLNDARPNKRALLVRRLLDNRRAYADHWLTFWNDILRNEYRGTGFIDGGRKQITGWLYESLYNNKPYNRFVQELISPVDGSEGFTKGIIWRGVVNASQRPEMQAAQNISQVFMGANLKCASCHNSFVNDWKLTDAYALASVFAEKPLEIHRCNKPTGKTSDAGFLFPQLGSIDGKAPRVERMKQLAAAVTNPQNGRLTRTMVNRLWARLFGRGLVEPVDEMANEPWNGDLLDWLAVDLSDHKYDLKHTLETICTSRAYQRPSVGAPKPGVTDYDFQGPLVRRMSAEQFIDAVASLTVNPRKATSAMLRPDGRGQGGQLSAIAKVLATETVATTSGDVLRKTMWIWNDKKAARAVPGGRLLLRQELTLVGKPVKVTAAVSADNHFKLFINGDRVAVGSNWNQPVTVDLSGRLKAGRNLIAVETGNDPVPKKGEKADPKSTSPAGFILAVTGTNEDGTHWSFGSDATWIVSNEIKPGWEKLDFDSKGWKHAVEVGTADAGPWKLGNRLLFALSVLDETVRASLTTSDPLMRALGRPNREQVVTRRDSLATMLQALELTNGSTLDALLDEGSRRWLNDKEMNADDLIDAIYTTALGRKPNEKERTTAAQLIGSPVSQQGVSDLLWALSMLPEFQLIY